ncbi:hypothetical protein [Phormidium sp. CCY1219]|uniref:hypothetical protein n=1 Tax=Phormidium sp. CCY1219 TaxID=2886104 RepID=UPI002D1EC721|nr:hypothetical protein [Phormidium sp. CCY1219]MEB3829169.1 hypothetical protein [Phormidium sp. CCY1219]
MQNIHLMVDKNVSCVTRFSAKQMGEFSAALPPTLILLPGAAPPHRAGEKRWGWANCHRPWKPRRSLTVYL